MAALLVGGPASALDKQGSAHGGDVAGSDQGFAVAGSLILGSAVHNPSYAARPDNTGLALMRYALHLDVDLIGRRLSVPLDINLFTDRTRRGGRKLAPTEFDVISGLTSTWTLGPGALEVGSRVEHDRPLDQGSFTQTYVDVRTRYLYSLAKVFPGLGPALGDGDVSGALTLGWFAYNPTYAARPDNTGKAIFRYGARSEVSILDDILSFGLDATFFTDRDRNVVRPSELDLTPELIGHLPPFELHLAYERDMPLDRSGLTQQFVYLLGVWGFDLARPKPAPLYDRAHPVSP
ncbi:MAG: hypothetical protein EOO75_12175 [Myxococcales bacterium]|nr:MAG: hypothetical protein EOO75_12175 [Myxococcales bacterium]